MSVNLNAIGLSGIIAAEAEFAATESNLTNASNPNYSVESVNLATLAGVGGEGAGVSVLGIQRADTPFLDSEINQSNASQSFYSAYSQPLQAAENIVAPGSGTDLGQAVQNLFDSFSNLAASPEDASARSSVLSAAANLSQIAQSTSSGLSQAAAQSAAGIATMVGQVNQDAQQVAQLNGQIIVDQANGGSAAALLDQRDALVNDLAGLIGASADSNGNVSVNGTPLVSGTTALTLSESGSGASIQIALPDGSIQLSQPGGQIGGALSAVSSLTSLQNNLNSFVTSVAKAVNAQQEAGYGLDGSTGVPIFELTAGEPIAVNPALTTQNIAAAASASGVPGDGSNAGAIAALASAVGVDSSLPTGNVQQAFAQITSRFGATVQTAQNNQTQAAASLSSLTTLQSSTTGVSLNAELTKLIQYQNDLQATTQAVQAANNMVSYLIQQL
ncbi:MAG: flagellar hook-associated protein FlgK [Candidatus Binatales bacterium]